MMYNRKGKCLRHFMREQKINLFVIYEEHTHEKYFIPFYFIRRFCEIR